MRRQCGDLTRAVVVVMVVAVPFLASTHAHSTHTKTPAHSSYSTTPISSSSSSSSSSSITTTTPISPFFFTTTTSSSSSSSFSPVNTIEAPQSQNPPDEELQPPSPLPPPPGDVQEPSEGAPEVVRIFVDPTRNIQGRIVTFPRPAEEGAGETREDIEDSLTMRRTSYRVVNAKRLPSFLFAVLTIKQRIPVPSSNQNLPSTLPVALSRCSSSETWPVNYNITSINCPSKSIRKTNLAEERKIVYVNGTFYFSWNHVLADDFCVLDERNRSGGVEVAVCLRPSLATRREGEGCRGVKSCLKKCCPEGFQLQGTTCVCQDSLTNAASVISGFLDLWDKQKGVDGEDMEVGVGLPKCDTSKNVKIDLLSMRSDLALLANGSLWAEAEMSFIDYCVDEEEEEKEKDKDSEEERSDEMLPGRTLILITCSDAPPVANTSSSSAWQEVRRVLIPAGLVVSCVFLAATLLCQLCVAPLRDRHGLCLAAYVAALLVADATLFLTQAFSKLTVQAVPLYRSPADFRCFVAYAVYAWGTPLLIGGVAVVLHSLPDHVDWLLRPDFVHNSCWFRVHENTPPTQTHGHTDAGRKGTTLRGVTGVVQW
ncbi:hypothetical protein O3P69_016698 [Scylla paramamosain]|uniref:G-protein coupled receptors family 2 profile 2 domain-containing protein n=1 Tax=Scylla paramamosain TaxID=85552 RepID=A0AAW0SZ23_SCYPA